MTATTLFQYLLIFLILLWPVWAIATVFAHWLLNKIGLLLRRLRGLGIEAPAIPQGKEQPNPVEKMLNSSA